jgi:hypothetical protein
MFKKVLLFHRHTAHYHYRFQVMVRSITPELGAVIGTTACLYFNLWNINFILKLFFDVPVLDPVNIFTNNWKIVVTVYMGLLLLLNYLYLMADGKFKIIIKEFSNDSVVERRKWKIVTVTYTLATYIIYFVLMFITST